MHGQLMRALRAVTTAAVVVGCAATGIPAMAQPPAQPPPSCPVRLAPPPPVDTSEQPPPGMPPPAPVAVPDEPVGGDRMGECGLVLPAQAPPLPPDITAASWLVADLDSGAVIAAHDPHGRHRPASTIKLLTALVASGLPPDRVVVANHADAAQEGSSAGIGPGGRYTVRQLLSGLLLSSGNDAAHALARQLGGVRQTLEAMNARAARLGALDTRAATPSGLDGPGMSTSAYDLALIMRAVLREPLLAELLATPRVNFPGFGGRPGFVLSNDNKLMANYPGAIGGKTGFTDDARHTYVGAAERGERRLVTVVLRGEQRPIRLWEQAARLLDFGFATPAGASVGELVDGPPRPQTAEPTTTEAPAAPAVGNVAQNASTTGNGPGIVATVSLWLGGGGLLLALLAGLIALQRRHLGTAAPAGAEQAEDPVVET